LLKRQDSPQQSRFAASGTRVLGASRQSDTQSDTGQSDCCDYAEGAKDGPRSRDDFFVVFPV